MGIYTYRAYIIVVVALGGCSDARRGERKREESDDEVLAKHFDVWYNGDDLVQAFGNGRPKMKVVL